MQKYNPYEVEWFDYTSSLRRIAWHLPEEDDRRKLEVLINEVEKLIAIASKNVKLVVEVI